MSYEARHQGCSTSGTQLRAAISSSSSAWRLKNTALTSSGLTTISIPYDCQDRLRIETVVYQDRLRTGVCQDRLGTETVVYRDRLRIDYNLDPIYIIMSAIKQPRIRAPLLSHCCLMLLITQHRCYDKSR